jgi:alkylation response protein AidB-like acyl-CoA dehydrogenase
MHTYAAPLREMRFVLHELHDSASLRHLTGLEEITPDLLDSILEEAAKFIGSVLLPLNASGDAEGCHYENGLVRTPKGFKAAYQAFIEGGWGSLNADPAYGGQDLPASLGKLVGEMISGSNLSFGMYPGLTHGAYLALKSHGSEALKKLYLPKLVNGSWTGTMCLTEAHCGTDLGLLRTTAVPRADGSFELTGSKIFISAGEHDLTENIIHLVLARLPDAPAGAAGISLFVVPKFLPNPDGTIGMRNGVTCGGIEHKLGIRASATCQMNFDAATGWLVGEPHKGMRAMFVMMNSERLAVGIQGLGLGEAAYQTAAAYARQRLQGRAPARNQPLGDSADPIIAHPDVRRMLMTMRACNEGCRALGVWVANELDRMERSRDAAEREAASDFVALLTPVVKALFTDFGFESASLALQVHGGHGYIVEQGVEQLLRDARITMIYEGTNGVQALDLVGRKLVANMGRPLRRFLHPVSQFIASHERDPQIGSLVRSFAESFGVLQVATAHIVQTGSVDPEEAAAAATEYLRMFGLVALGFMWVRMAKVAVDALPDTEEDAAFYRSKRATAAFYIQRILPQAGALLHIIQAGKASVVALEATAF